MSVMVHVLSATIGITLCGICVTQDSVPNEPESDVQTVSCNWRLSDVPRSGFYRSACDEVTVEYLDSNKQDPQREWANPW